MTDEDKFDTTGFDRAIGQRDPVGAGGVRTHSTVELSNWNPRLKLNLDKGFNIKVNGITYFIERDHEEICIYKPVQNKVRDVIVSAQERREVLAAAFAELQDL